MQTENQATTDWHYDAEEHLRRQLLRDAALPLREKLRWLEEAHHTVLHLQKQADRAGKTPKSLKEET